MHATTAAILLKKLFDTTSKESGNFRRVLKEIASHPIKMVATFLTAPFLLLRIAKNVEDPTRRKIAITGITVSLIFAYLAGTFLGTIAGAALIAANIGIFFGLAFLIGTSLSVFLSVAFSFLVLNFVSLLFLKMNKQEIIKHLDKEST